MDNSSYSKKVGILGGTFNPIHVGHLIIAQNALERCGLDKVLIMPSGCSYLKDPDDVADVSDRVEMTRLAIEDNDRFELSTIEADREGNSYTCETLDILTSRNPDTRYYYIIGADTLFSMERWKRPFDIFSACTIVCARRDNVPDKMIKAQAGYLQDNYNADVIIMDDDEIPISSTFIREMIADGRSCRYYLDKKVVRYINDNGLYRKQTV